MKTIRKKTKPAQITVKETATKAKEQTPDDFREKAENILDLRAFEKGNRGGPVTYEEFQRSERYRKNHPAEAATADAKRPVESFKDAMLRDKDYSEQPPKNEEAEKRPAQLTIEEFVVPVTWLIVSARIPAQVAECLESRTSGPAKCWGESVSNCYSDAVFTICMAPEDGLPESQLAEKVKRYLPASLTRWEDLRGHKSATFRFLIKSSRWDYIKAIANISGHTECALIRGALWQHYCRIIELEKEQQNRDRMAALGIEAAHGSR